jgi:hypothetical protein
MTPGAALANAGAGVPIVSAATQATATVAPTRASPTLRMRAERYRGWLP